MYVLFTAFMIINVLFSFIDWIVVGTTDMHVTKLTAALSENATTIEVNNAGGYRLCDYIRIGDEKIRYNGHTETAFLAAVRAYEGTEATAHPVGSHVYGRQSDVMNASVGFNIVNMGATVGQINAWTLVTRFAATTLPAMVTWNFYWMKDGFWQYLRLLFVGISGGLILVMTFQILAALGGLFQSAFRP